MDSLITPPPPRGLVRPGQGRSRPQPGRRV